MSHHGYPAGFGAALALTMALGAGAVFAGEAGAGDRKRNVLFLAIDDLRPMLGAYGDRLVHTPNIDALAARGLTFQRAYVQQAVCGASRASLMTGMRPDTTGIHTYFGSVSEHIPEALTLNRNFRNNGYETISIGKVYHEKDDDPGGWTRRPYDILTYQQGRRQQAVLPETYMAMVRQRESRERALALPYEMADVGDRAYQDGHNTDFAIHELHRLAHQRKPFFLVLGLRKPHLPFNVPKKYWDLYDAADFTLPEYDKPPRGAPGYAYSNYEELRRYAGVPQGREPLPRDLALQLIHGYHAAVSYADAQAGRILGALADLGLAGNTIVVLWGDHGYKLGEYAAWAKHTNYEIDVRVPLIFAGPGIPAGARSDALVETVDIYPTLADMTGLDQPEDLEGMSFLALFDDPQQAWKQAAFSQYLRDQTAKGALMGYSMKTGQFRYTVWVRRASGEIIDRELYDHRTDPGETRNVAADPEYEAALRQLDALREKGWPGVRADLRARLAG